MISCLPGGNWKRTMNVASSIWMYVATTLLFPSSSSGRQTLMCFALYIIPLYKCYLSTNNVNNCLAVGRADEEYHYANINILWAVSLSFIFFILLNTQITFFIFYFFCSHFLSWEYHTEINKQNSVWSLCVFAFFSCSSSVLRWQQKWLPVPGTFWLSSC